MLGVSTDEVGILPAVMTHSIRDLISSQSEHDTSARGSRVPTKGRQPQTHKAIGINTEAINALTSFSLSPSPLTYTPANQNLPTNKPVAKHAVTATVKVYAARTVDVAARHACGVLWPRS